MSRSWLLSLLMFVWIPTFAQSSTQAYTVRDSDTLLLDIYLPQDTEIISRPCVVYLFGGGFVVGERNSANAQTICKSLCQQGFVVAAIDYRLGLRDKVENGGLGVKALNNAIQMAVEDLYDATNYLIQHASTLGIDTQKIILYGTSAGAVVALQADYELHNQRTIAKTLPQNFRFAGIVSFAGGILSHHGNIKYSTSPSPMLMFHGTKDKLVPYNKIQIFNLGFFGSNQIAKQLVKFNLPFSIVRIKGYGHEVANLMTYAQPDVLSFIKTYIVNRKFLQEDKLLNDPTIPHTKIGAFSPRDLGKLKDK